MSGDCRECKDWRTCIGKTRICPKCKGSKRDKGRICDECDGAGYVWEGYLFAELRWCPYQIMWVLANADILHAGKWPPQYSPCEEPKKGKRVSKEGYFVKPAIIIAEVEKRLETTGTSGKHLVSQSKAGETLGNLDNEAWEVLMYVKGRNRKVYPFPEWKYQQRYRKKKQQMNRKIYSNQKQEEKICIGSA